MTFVIAMPAVASPYSVVSEFTPSYGHPVAPLFRAADGTFYGTTSDGGDHGLGSVFRLEPAGGITTLHSFNSSDGANPQAGVIESGGFIYGTTREGGAAGFGTIFRLDPSSRTLSTLHSFTERDGFVETGVIDSGGSLYGTTPRSGTLLGTVYRLALTTGNDLRAGSGDIFRRCPPVGGGCQPPMWITAPVSDVTKTSNFPTARDRSLPLVTPDHPASATVSAKCGRRNSRLRPLGRHSSRRTRMCEKQPLRFLECRDGLLSGHGWKIFEELVERMAALQIVDEVSGRHPGTDEDGSAAQNPGIAMNDAVGHTLVQPPPTSGYFDRRPTALVFHRRVRVDSARTRCPGDFFHFRA